MHNLRSWKEWSDVVPEPHMSGFVEAEYVDDSGCLAYTRVNLFHYNDERGSTWGHSTGAWREGTYKTHHPKYYRWRFFGPLVPSREAQGGAVIIWVWSDSPSELRCLSPHGGDEDYVALVPKGMEQPSFLETGTRFGCCSVSEHELDDGRRAFIGAHA